MPLALNDAELAIIAHSAHALPLKLVQARLGHASIQMTADRYGHLFPSGDDGTELAAAEKALLTSMPH
jgi:integrase